MFLAQWNQWKTVSCSERVWLSR